MFGQLFQVIPRHTKATVPQEILQRGLEMVTGRWLRRSGGPWLGSGCARGLAPSVSGWSSKKSLKKEETAVFSGGQVADRIKNL